MVHVDGNEVPTVTGRVTGIAEKSGFVACLARLRLVGSCWALTAPQSKSNLIMVAPRNNSETVEIFTV
jgi:hypothetical protein